MYKLTEQELGTDLKKEQTQAYKKARAKSNKMYEYLEKKYNLNKCNHCCNCVNCDKVDEKIQEANINICEEFDICHITFLNNNIYG